MRFLFLVPPLSKEVLHGEWDLSGVDSVSPPIGVLILASVLKGKGHEVKIIDAYARSLAMGRVLEKIRQYSPDALGISFMTPAFDSALSLARAVKKELPEVAIVAGGAHVTAAPETVLEHKTFDFGVIGEGEITLPDLLDALQRKAGISSINGIAFRNGEGRIVITPRRDFIRDMDEIPFPDWGAVDLSNYRLSPIGVKGRFALPLLTSRGCPCRCTFCDTGGVGAKIRGFSAAYVIAMMGEVIGKYGISEFVFYDDTFVALKGRTFEICEEIIRRGWRISWSCCARVDCVTREMLEVMRRAGCWQVEYGIESGSQAILDRINKRIQTSKVKDVVRWTRTAGLQTRGNFIFGLPGDTRQTIESTIEFACSLDLDYFQQSFLTPYPGSKIYEDAGNEGMFDRDWRKMNNMTINFIPRGMTKEELVCLSKEAFRKFYLRPKIAASHLSWLVRNPGMARNYARAFGAYIKTVLR